MRWLFPGKEVRIDSRCLDCGEPIMVRTKDAQLLEATPSTIVGHFTVPLRQWGQVPNGYL